MENPFEIIISKIDRIEAILSNLNTSNFKEPTKDYSSEILDINQLSELLGLKKNTLYLYTAKRKIPHYKKGRKLFFKRNEIIDWISTSKVKTYKEIEEEASNYIIRRKNR